MPTGYTSTLENMDYDLGRWLKECAIRGMGVCLTLRDSSDMPEKDIRAALAREEERDSYHEKALKEAKEARAKGVSVVDYSSGRARASAEYEKRKVEHDRKSAAHREVIAKTRALLVKARNQDAGEVTVNTLQFALDQLEQAYRFDYGSGPYRDKILDQTFEEWKEATEADLDWRVNYHTEEMAKETSRNHDRLVEYDKFVAFVNAGVKNEQVGKDRRRGG